MLPKILDLGKSLYKSVVDTGKEAVDIGKSVIDTGADLASSVGLIDKSPVTEVKPDPIPDHKPLVDKEPPKNSRIEQYQRFMETSPLGVSYKAKEYGILDPALISSLSALESRLIDITGDPTIKGKLVSGGSINYSTSPGNILSLLEKPGKSDVIAFKKYLNGMGMYNGDINSSVADPQLISALKSIENDIAKKIGSESVKGLIWQGKGINPDTSPADVQSALELLKTKKTAQSLDTFEVNREDNPIGLKFIITDDDSEIESGDPYTDQHIGKTDSAAPKRLDILKSLLESSNI